MLRSKGGKRRRAGHLDAAVCRPAGPIAINTVPRSRCMLCFHTDRVHDREETVTGAREFTPQEARAIGDTIGIDWMRIPLEEFRIGLSVELEHGAHDPQTNVTGDDPILTGKIDLAHLKEFADYYTRLRRME